MRFFNTSMIPIQITVKKDDGTEKELFAFQDNSGFVLTKKQLVDKENSLMEILEKAIERRRKDWSSKMEGNNFEFRHQDHTLQLQPCSCHLWMKSEQKLTRR